ncbi:hypothetical protein P389DRAFT_174030 [Cystobasidium minutum MCA 4210]|uniref:uncharacterized protein n=1 Tax=Cystobasidium minutum MCA 4210 TaxID=1397322 RepID=UPI0034CEAB4D|eukprot:jgi/Rhomi1/174030/fgenesh1_kg.7_\
MSHLPPEIITRIFKEVEASGLESPYEWWSQSDDVHAFFDTASLVCKRWNTLAKPFRTCFTIASNTQDEMPNEWNGGYTRNGNSLSQSITVKSLHVEWMEDDKDDEEFVLVLPLSFREYLVAAENTLCSLSLQGELLQQDIPKNSLGIDVILQRLLRQVECLHVYSDASGYTEYGHIVIPGYELPWSALAEAWSPGRTKPLKELALSVIPIDGPIDLQHAPSCPARTIVFHDVWFENELEFSELFPNVETFVWKQSADWNAPTPYLPSTHLKHETRSKTLKHLQVDAWSCQYPPDGDGELFKSPNLRTLHFRHLCKTNEGFCIAYALLSGLLARGIPTLQEVRIDDLAGRVSKSADTIRSSLKASLPSTFLATPVHDLPAGCLALYVRNQY